MKTKTNVNAKDALAKLKRAATFGAMQLTQTTVGKLAVEVAAAFAPTRRTEEQERADFEAWCVEHCAFSDRPDVWAAWLARARR